MIKRTKFITFDAWQNWWQVQVQVLVSRENLMASTSTSTSIATKLMASTSASTCIEGKIDGKYKSKYKYVLRLVHVLGLVLILVLVPNLVKCCYILASIMMNKQIIFAELNLHLFDLFITGNFWCSFCHVWCTGSGSRAVALELGLGFGGIRLVWGRKTQQGVL